MTEKGKENNKNAFNAGGYNKAKRFVGGNTHLQGRVFEITAKDAVHQYAETVKAIAEELDVKAAHLNKAIKIAHKATLQDERDKLVEIEDILEAAGRMS